MPYHFTESTIARFVPAATELVTNRPRVLEVDCGEFAPSTVVARLRDAMAAFGRGSFRYLLPVEPNDLTEVWNLYEATLVDRRVIIRRRGPKETKPLGVVSQQDQTPTSETATPRVLDAIALLVSERILTSVKVPTLSSQEQERLYSAFEINIVENSDKTHTIC